MRGPVPYPTHREQIFGLGSFEGLGQTKAVRRRRKTVCARKLPYKWLRVNPCIELPDNAELPPVTNSRDAARIMHGAVDYAGRGVEYSMVMGLDSQNKPTSIAVVSQGGRASTIIDPSVVFQPMILSNAVAFIFAHNHPSNVTNPSDEDVAFTKKLKRGASLVGLQMLDSIVLNDEGDVFSFLDRGLMYD